jgi:DNA-binding response OmpR family regulator
MLGPVETLLKHAGSKDKVLLELIYRNANRVLTLDEQLLELTRLETRNQKLKLVEGDIVIVLKGIASAFQSLAERRKIQYLYEFDLNEPFAIFDADVVEKIINNLLTNAFKFTPDQGTVSITAGIVQPRDIPGKKIATGKKSSRYIHIEVKDSGIGIPEKYLGKIFDRFFQVSEGKNHSQNGNGIGLALTKELVDLNHGWITLVSKENQGSLFSVFLPIDKEAFTAEEIRNVSGYSTGKIAGEDQGIMENAPDFQEEEGTFHAENNEDNELRKILIVEDNSDMRRYLGITLSDHYEVISAVEGAEGFRMACTTHPDLIITDLMMPGIDGMEFCRKIKSEERTSHIPVIMLTALASTLDRIAGFETGADDYIGKPFSNPELLARIKNLISQRTKLRHLFGTEMKVQPSDVTVTSVDERFLQRLIKAIEDQIDNPEIDIEYLTKSVNMSRSQLHQKLKALTGLPATGFVKIIRLKRAASLMEQNFGNVSDISYAVGFTNLSYFSKCFREVYHESPSDYLSKVVKQ